MCRSVCFGGGGHAAVFVFKADDVIFAQVLAGLHFDHDAALFAGVVEPVFLAGGDVGALVGVDGDVMFAVRDVGRAGDDDPVFAAVAVHLQAERGARLDFDALDFEALAVFQHGVGAPGSVHGAVQFVGLVPLRFELLVEVFDVLRV